MHLVVFLRRRAAASLETKSNTAQEAEHNDAGAYTVDDELGLAAFTRKLIQVELFIPWHLFSDQLVIELQVRDGLIVVGFDLDEKLGRLVSLTDLELIRHAVSKQVLRIGGPTD